MATPRKHIEKIRRQKFSIGAEETNPLTEDLHQAVKNLSAELYTKDVHFLMELIQNAEDNEYEECVDPSLQFVITSKDITGTGATSTLLIFNNEKGFSPKNIESICSVGRSTKKNNRKRGYIGEKGIGFKSVFLITSQPYIFSNGYQIHFNETPCSECNVGYIVPEWVVEKSILSEIKHIYGSSSNFPTTTIVLPLKPDKVKPVKQQLSSIHPELLLFLSKIKRLSVREDTEDPRCNSVRAISISSETNFVTRKNMDAESYLLHLSADEKDDNLERECSYHMWRQRFPVRQENKVERRMGVEEWVITLAFPNGERLHRGSTSPGIYAFLPTEMVTNFPFIIQADFLLASSRETILLDCTWNQGILNCVPVAFVDAFTSLVKSREDAHISLLPRMFGFLPVVISPYDLLNSVRTSIQSELREESIIPCESYTDQKFFHKPHEVGRLMPTFWNLLEMAREQGVSLDNISTHGKYILSSAFDEEEYNDVLNFLGVEYVDDEWYAKCVRSSNLVLGVSEDLYLELLLFIAENWGSFSNTNIVEIPLLKYAGAKSQVSLCRINEVSRCREILYSSKFNEISWLIDWNGEFLCANNRFFLPKSTQCGIFSHSKMQTIDDWLMKEVKVRAVSAYDYALLLKEGLGNDTECVVSYVHFLYHSLRNNLLSTVDVDYVCNSMPLVNNYGQVIRSRKGVLVPANGSRWVQLIGSNPWRNEGYVELGKEYLYSRKHAGVLTREEELLQFLKSHVAASDIPDLPPPNAQISSFSSLLTKQNAFFLLEWVHNLKEKGIYMPGKFFKCIKNGSWLRVLLGGSVSCKPPSQSFLLTSAWADLQNGSVFVDIPVVDQSFYGEEISNYKEELQKVGVLFEFSEACKYIGNHLMSTAVSSTLTRVHVFSILNFIRFLRAKLLPPDDFINRIKDEKWLRTSQGDRSPVESVFYDEEWEAASKISDIPFIDRDYYGKEILSFHTELQLLGVVFGFCGNYKLLVDNLKSPSCFMSLTAEAVLLLLDCMCHLSSSAELARVLKDTIRLKTNMGYKSPAECYLYVPTWGCLLQVFNCFPLVDVQFYGESLLSFRNELKKIGVLVDFEEAKKAFIRVFRRQASLSSINKDNVLSLLACYRKLKGTDFKFSSDLKECIQEVKWLRTRLTDCRAPKDCILFSPDWIPISTISMLPFIDDGENYYGKVIHEYKKELQSMGVVVSFKHGAMFLASSLRLPRDPSSITAEAACSLLECIRNFPMEHDEPLDATLSQKVAGNWIKTHAGYRSPGKCLLFGSDWGSTLLPEDGPFIDKTFYGPNISSYSKELSALGVVIEKRGGCALLASYLDTCTNFMAIKRIYSYLNEFNWKSTILDVAKIWIPNGSNDGEWISSGECVLHDRDGLFGQQLNILDKYYEKKLLNFFSNALEVKNYPSLDDYCKLWRDWEDSGHLLSRGECIAFWSFVAKHWSPVTQKVLSENILKLPVLSGSDRIPLMDKYDIFIADDLCLKDLLEQFASQHLFVWYPQPSLQSLPRKKLLDIYSKIGVRNLSESVQKSEQSPVGGVVPMQVNDPKEVFIGRGLFKLILGFLADLQIEVQKRHDALKGLLKITVLETATPLTVDYSLLLSSGEIMNVSARRLMRWEREKSEFFMQKMDKSSGHKNVLERATYFSEVISEGLLWDKEDNIQQLAELIKLGFFMEFDEAAIEFLMKTKNLQIFLEDEEFLSSAFSS